MTDKQNAMAAVAAWVEQAKNLLASAKEMADENGIAFSYETFYEEATGNWVDWNSSNCY